MIACSLMAGSVFALPSITVWKGPNFGTTGGGEFLIEPKHWTFTPASLREVPGRFESFCLETNEYIRFNSTDRPKEYYVKISDAAVRGGAGGRVTNPAPAGGGTMDPLDQMTAYLYHQFITGQLADYDYAGVGGTRRDSADALQYAIWHIEDEIESLPDGLATTFYQDAQEATTIGSDGEILVEYRQCSCNECF